MCRKAERSRQWCSTSHGESSTALMSQNSFLQRNSLLHCNHEVQSVYEITHRQDCEPYRVAKEVRMGFCLPKSQATCEDHVTATHWALYRLDYHAWVLLLQRDLCGTKTKVSLKFNVSVSPLPGDFLIQQANEGWCNVGIEAQNLFDATGASGSSASAYSQAFASGNWNAQASVSLFSPIHFLPILWTLKHPTGHCSKYIICFVLKSTVALVLSPIYVWDEGFNDRNKQLLWVCMYIPSWQSLHYQIL